MTEFKRIIAHICMFMFYSNSVILSASANEDIRTELLNALDNVEATADGLDMDGFLQQRIDRARGQIMNASPEELEAIPEDVRGSLRILELSTAQMRLGSALEGQTVKKKQQRLTTDARMLMAVPQFVSGPLAEPNYPELGWGFAFESPGLPGDSDTIAGSFDDLCKNPGYKPVVRFKALNLAVVTQAVKDIAEQFCGLDVLGENANVACVVTDIVAYVAIGIDKNQEECNDLVTAAEVTATWKGMKIVHGNIQSMHDLLSAHDNGVRGQIQDHDADIQLMLERHDTDIKDRIDAHDADIKAKLEEILSRQGEMLTNQARIIELLNTPQGRRPDWPAR